MAAAHITTLDIVVLIVYFTATMAVGGYFWRKSRSVAAFTVAGSSLPGWLTGLSILGTYLSSISFLALPGKSYASNWNPFVYSISIPVAAWVAVRWFLPFYRNTGHASAYSHLEERFGPWARVYASSCYLLTQVARIATVSYLTALPLYVLLGWDIRAIILLVGVTTTVYTFVGGIAGVIWTDAIQTVVLMTGAVMCAVILLQGIPGGTEQLMQLASESHKFSLGSFGPELGEATFWVLLAYGLVGNLQNFGVDQSYIQRYHASRSEAEAKKSVWLAALLYIPLSALFFFIGTALYVFYKVNDVEVPAEYLGVGGGDMVFPWFIVSQLPAGITGLLIASIFAAGMSTVSSSINSSATVFMTDFHVRFLNPKAEEQNKMRVLHVATMVFGMIGTLLAMALVDIRSALDSWWNLAGIFSGGMLGLFLLGIMSRQATKPAALVAVSMGVLLILWLSLSPGWTGPWALFSSPFHGFLTIVFGTSTILIVGLLLTIVLSALRQRARSRVRGR